MSDDRKPSELVQIAGQLNHAEAAIFAAFLEDNGIKSQVVGGELADNLSYFGTAIGGARVLVAGARAAEASRAYERFQCDGTNVGGSLFPDGFDFGDPAPEPVEPETTVTDAETHPNHEKLMSRAFRAAVFGLPLFAFFVGLYSMWLIFRHRLWSGLGSSDWRLYVSLLCNSISFAFGKWLWFD